MSTDLTVPTPPLPGTSIVVKAELLAQVSALEQAMGDAPVITDQTSFDIVRDVVKRSRTLYNLVEAQRAAVKAPFIAVGKAIDEAARPILTRLNEVAAEGKDQETAFIVERNQLVREQEATRAAAEAAARATHAALAQAGRPTPELVVLQPVPVINAPLTTVRTVVVTNEAAIPQGYWVLDLERLNADALALHARGAPMIPGVEVIVEKRVVSR